MKKIFLTSAVTVCFALPAFAESFPGNGYMLENKTYDGAATYTNMGVYSDSVDATADYTNNEYNVVAGTYLPAASETVTQCPANSFCPGLTGPTYYDANNAQGATACSTLTGGYNSSDAGASAETDCYKACTTSNVAHSTAVRGNDYYGAGVDTCAATGCENGYHVKESLNLNTIIGDEKGSSAASKGIDGSSSGNPSAFGLTENGTFGVTYYNDKGTIKGRAQCSSQSGIGAWDDGNGSTSDPDEITNVATLPDSTGRYCWCKLESYTPVNGTEISLSSPWVLRRNIGDDVSACANQCADYCSALSADMSDYLIFRAAVMGAAVSTEPATCEANTITINWSDVDGVNGTHTTDVSYDGDITTPVKAATKPGKTFVGWKFVKPGS